MFHNMSLEPGTAVVNARPDRGESARERLDSRGLVLEALERLVRGGPDPAATPSAGPTACRPVDDLLGRDRERCDRDAVGRQSVLDRCAHDRGGQHPARSVHPRGPAPRRRRRAMSTPRRELRGLGRQSGRASCGRLRQGKRCRPDLPLACKPVLEQKPCPRRRAGGARRQPAVELGQPPGERCRLGHGGHRTPVGSSTQRRAVPQRSTGNDRARHLAPCRLQEGGVSQPCLTGRTS